MEAGGRDHLAVLTPLRGLAALLVVLYHYADIYFPNLHPEAFTAAVGKGYLAVDLFFLLSGFVITHAYRGAFADGVTAVGYTAFVKARIARLYPLHVTVLALFVATALATMGLDYALSGQARPIPLEGWRSVEAIGANLLMLQGFDAGDLSWNAHAWSLTLEFTAYLLFPFLLPPLWRAGMAIRLAVAATMAACIAAVVVMQDGSLNAWDGPITLLRCVPQFVLGALLHDAWRSGWGARHWERDVALGGALLGTAIALHLGAPDLFFPPLFLAVILAGAHNHGRLARIAAWRPLAWLGDVSFSLYLVHGLVQYATTRALEFGLGTRDRSVIPAGWSLVLMAGMIAASLVLAGVTYPRVEVAGRRWLRRVLEVPRGAVRAQVAPLGPESGRAMAQGRRSTGKAGTAGEGGALRRGGAAPGRAAS